MLRKPLLLLLMLALALLVGCTKEVKVQSEDSKLALEAFSVAEGLRAAYVKKDFKAMAALSTEDGYSSLRPGFGDFLAVELTFTPRWVDIDDDRLAMNVSWKGTWDIRGRKYPARGMAVMELVGNPLRLNRILRANPFMPPE